MGTKHKTSSQGSRAREDGRARESCWKIAAIVKRWCAYRGLSEREQTGVGKKGKDDCGVESVASKWWGRGERSLWCHDKNRKYGDPLCGSRRGVVVSKIMKR